MKVGDLVECNNPSYYHTYRRLGARVGMIVENVGHNKGIGCTNKVFKVLWHNGTVGNNVWDHDLKLVNES